MKFRSMLPALSVGLAFAALAPLAGAQAPAPVATPPASAPPAATPAPVPAPTAVQGDLKRGKVLAYTCHGCHGIANYKNVYPTFNVPKLGGQQAAYIVAALKEYATQQRAHPTMYSHASTLSEQDMQDIAVFFSGQPVAAAGEVVGTPPVPTATCVACHGNRGVGITPDYPTLAGQYADYMEHALRDYKAGRRKNPIMAGFVAALTEEDIEALAAFYASQQPSLCGTEVIQRAAQCP